MKYYLENEIPTDANGMDELWKHAKNIEHKRSHTACFIYMKYQTGKSIGKQISRCQG